IDMIERYKEAAVAINRMGGRRMKISDRESVAKNYGRKRMQFSDGLATAL
ncbi:hypothetical protein Tco_1544107, partial [Tanacetum coccineum]